MNARRMTWIAAWCAVAVPVAFALGWAIRRGEQQARTPQLDVPLWRHTDLPRFLQDEPAPEPRQPSALLGGAILGLAFAVDETSARYWLAQCARRGSTPEQLTELWDGWVDAQRSTVVRLHTDREDPRP